MFYNSSVARIYENGRHVSLVSIALPKFCEMFFVQMISTVNTLMLSGYSEEAVAAVSVSGQIQNLIVIILNIIISGMMIVMSVELGKENREQVAKIAGTAFFMMLTASVVIGITTAFFSEQLVGIMNLEGNAGIIAASVFRIRMKFLFITMLMSCFNNMLICNGYAMYAVIVGLLSNVLNAVFCYIVLYSSLKIPVDEVDGVAVAAILAQLLAMLLSIFFLTKKKCPFKFTCKAPIVKTIVRIGTPSGLGMVSYTFTQVISTGFMAALGIMTLNAKVYISNIINYTSKIGWAVAQGNGVLVGRYRGRDDFESMKILHRQNMMLAVISNSVLSLLAFAFHRPLISMFSDDPEILLLAGSVMAVDVIVEIARAVNNISEQSLNANGDVKTTFIIPMITCWFFGVLVAYILGIKCGLGLVGCWIGFALDEMFKATMYVIRWKKGKWQKTVI